MILLAMQLGLRGSYIKNLKFHDIDWDKETITVVQSKTKEHVALPFFEDVGVAPAKSALTLNKDYYNMLKHSNKHAISAFYIISR